MMMEEKQLPIFFLFRRLGAFSVVQENPRQAGESINYASKLLIENSNRTFWIFPQGEILPNDFRPIYFYNGFSRIFEKVGQWLVASLVIRYEFLGQFKPHIFVKISEPAFISVVADFNAKNLNKRFEKQLAEILDDLKNDVVNQNTEIYKSIG